MKYINIVMKHARTLYVGLHVSLYNLFFVTSFIVLACISPVGLRVSLYNLFFVTSFIVLACNSPVGLHMSLYSLFFVTSFMVLACISPVGLHMSLYNLCDKFHSSCMYFTCKGGWRSGTVLEIRQP